MRASWSNHISRICTWWWKNTFESASVGKAVWWVCIFAVVTKSLSFRDLKAVIIKVTLSSNAVSSKLPISHSILNVSWGLDYLFFRPHRFLPCCHLFILNPYLFLDVTPTSCPKQQLPPFSNAQSLLPSAPPLPRYKTPSKAQRSPAPPPQPRIRLLPLFHIQCGLKASKLTHKLSCILSVLAAVHDQHVCDPGLVLLVYHHQCVTESAWMRQWLAVWGVCGGTWTVKSRWV